jgi:hypothetical protein
MSHGFFLSTLSVGLIGGDTGGDSLNTPTVSLVLKWTIMIIYLKLNQDHEVCKKYRAFWTNLLSLERASLFTCFYW